MSSKENFSIEDLENGLMLSGFLAPQNEKELAELRVVQNSNEVKDDNVKLIIKQDQKKSKTYFTRNVLAAKIVSELHEEPTFGHVKLQKLMYLCEYVKHIDLSERYSKQAAGPYDRKLMHSVDSELKKQKWFNVSNENGRFRYEPMEKSNSFEKYYTSYFSTENDKIQWLIERFRKAKTEQVEIVATIHYCVQEIKKKSEMFSKELLLKYFYSFHKAKEKFDSGRIIKAYDWMIEKKLV